jgi:hypothetical protein
VSKDPFRLDNPLLVQWEYASEERLRTRNEAYRRLVRGVNADDVAFEAVAEVAPGRVLEVGCGGEPTRDLSFWSENGEERLREAFSSVGRRAAEGTLVFPGAQTLREYIAATITRAHLAENVPELEQPLETRSAHVVFVADK